MREIRFRGKVHGDWVEGIAPESDAWAWFWAVVDKDTVGEYVGIEDNNEKDIYEGDIVKFKQDDGGHDIGEIVYGKHNGAFCFRLPNIGIRVPMLNFMSTLSLAATYDFEVIGNVYENPELLEREEGHE